MNKSELLADLGAKSLRVVQTTAEQQTPAMVTAKLQPYTSYVVEQTGATVHGRNVGWYTLDEGEAGEVAFYRDQPVPKNVVRAGMQTYLSGLVPATYLRAEIQSVDEEQVYGIAKVLKDNGNGTVSEGRIVVWKNGANPIAHADLV